ncbi:carbohydrate diacid regulator [Chromobacterium alkanivorans]|uniref:sugar diacid recognition domain-containing protein n=1 Tax=Chromobacterium alkanivorans TaxID=1071719 RepID=UPI0021680BDB|nr:sugar diacid recognition domain-containing protein [Chromobacterium alkanivorans]MCS3802784.1 carbohydrate diacid regulator [Chromobacterium alkanivorans]MCS3817110.1 carbohydrate diacid regulator [Chromobacterium alkanivorans]MCS3872150.1 carbohydrate diacid regulator [Chromobacterium alkanivorans]
MPILTAELAQDIVSRTMRIIPFNVNVMDAQGAILGSGDAGRLGQLHDGALLALAQRRTVEIDEATAGKLHGSRPGINLPLHVDGRIAGVVGLTGQPDQVRQFGELVRLTAEMILEQAQLQRALQHDARQREAFVLEWIREESGAALDAWAQRLGLRLEQHHVALSLQLNEESLAADQAQAALHQLQAALAARWPQLLSAAAGPYELVLVEACDDNDETEREALLQRRLQALNAWLEQAEAPDYHLGMGIALPGRNGAAQSCRSARAAARIGRQRQAERRSHSYYDLALPVLLSDLDHGWQAQQLRLPLRRLEQTGKSGLRRTAETWFAHQFHPGATARALHIHRNTLDYRLDRIAEITGLDLQRHEDRFRLYIALLLA